MAKGENRLKLGFGLYKHMQWLLVANQDSDNIVVFKINQDDGLLKKHHINSEIRTGCCIQFL